MENILRILVSGMEPELFEMLQTEWLKHNLSCLLASGVMEVIRIVAGATLQVMNRRKSQNFRRSYMTRRTHSIY